MAQRQRATRKEASVPVERFMPTTATRQEMRTTATREWGEGEGVMIAEMMRKEALRCSTSLGQKLARRFGYLPETFVSDLECFMKAIGRLNGGEGVGGEEHTGNDREEDEDSGGLHTMNVYDRLFRSSSGRWNKKKPTAPDILTTTRASSTRYAEHQKQSRKQNGRYKPRIRPPVPAQESPPSPPRRSARKKKKMMKKKRRIKIKKKKETPLPPFPSYPESHVLSPGTPRAIQAVIPRQEEEESDLEQAENLRNIATGQVKDEERQRLAACSRPPPDGPQSPVATQLLARDLFHASIDMYSRALHSSADCTRAFLGRCYAYKRLGNARRALIDLDMVLNLLAMTEQADASDLEDPEDEDRRSFSSDDYYTEDGPFRRNPLRLSALWNMKGSLLIQSGLLEEGLASRLHAIRLEGFDGRSIDRFRADYAHHYRQVRSVAT